MYIQNQRRLHFNLFHTHTHAHAHTRPHTHTHTHTHTQSNAWKFVEPNKSSNLRPILLFIRMVYFSTSTATLCGTSLIEPLQWYTGLTVSLQVVTVLDPPLPSSSSTECLPQCLSPSSLKQSPPHHHHHHHHPH